jgi:hypothetical protein
MGTFLRYWPWWVVIGFLLVYELYAVIRHRPTLSRMVWRADERWRPLRYVVIPFVALLLAHFFFGLWR